VTSEPAALSTVTWKPLLGAALVREIVLPSQATVVVPPGLEKVADEIDPRELGLVVVVVVVGVVVVVVVPPLVGTVVVVLPPVGVVVVVVVPPLVGVEVVVVVVPRPTGIDVGVVGWVVVVVVVVAFATTIAWMWLTGITKLGDAATARVTTSTPAQLAATAIAVTATHAATAAPDLRRTPPALRLRGRKWINGSLRDP
jgi:hypothetical protein